VNDFVEECRREWRRLGVPDPVANEMAADLRADLEEAAAEGATPGDVLGAGAFDARAFATAWAAERGVIYQRSRIPWRGRRRLGLPLAIAALAVVAIVGAVLVVVASQPDEATRELFPAPPVASEAIRVVVPRRVAVSPDGTTIWVGPRGGTLVAVDSDEGSSETARIVGSVLLGAALAAILLATLVWWWRGSDRWPSGHAY
jgi:hypothetical protein